MKKFRKITVSFLGNIVILRSLMINFCCFFVVVFFLNAVYIDGWYSMFALYLLFSFFGGKLAELFWGEAAISKAYCYWILRLRNFKLFCNKIKILGLIGIDVWLILLLILFIYFDDKVCYHHRVIYKQKFIVYLHGFQTRYSLCLNFFVLFGPKFDCLNGKNEYFFRNLWDFWT